MNKRLNGKKLSRRDFLKIAGVTAVAVPTATGLGLLYSSRGADVPSDIESSTSQILGSSSTGDQPILILVNDASDSPFGVYLSEILFAEGIISFSTARLSEFDLERLVEFDTVVLTAGPLTREQAEALTRYVYGGGGLVAMKPDIALLPVLGLRGQEQDSDLGYMITEGGHALSAGIVPVSLQYHGAADRYLMDGAEAVAWLCDKTGRQKDHPAVSIHQYGEGWGCAWAYDLVESVILTRQGNPQWADQERDGFSDVRPSDMFYGWLDLDRIEIPQADEQQRLLVNALNFLSQQKKPLPRLWYFPGNAKSMLIATSDTHQNPGWAVERVIQHAEKYGGSISIYSMPPNYTVPYRAAQKVRWWLEDLSLMDEAYFPSPSRVADWRKRGHEFGIHVLVENGYEESWAINWQRFTGAGYGLPSPTTRVHRILWKGWVDSAKLQERYGFRMNLDFYHVGDGFRKPDGEWVYGHFTGSGLPMKFIDENGRLIHLYQQLTQLADDHLLNLHWGGTVKIPAEEAVQVSQSMMDRSLAGGYAAIGAIFHTDPFAVGEVWATEEGKWMDGTLKYAAENNIPIWSAERWLDFVEARHDSMVKDFQWLADENRLNFLLSLPDFRSEGMSLLLPLERSAARLSGVEVNGRRVEFKEHILSSQRYAMVDVTAGENSVDAYYR
ncbi:MAG: twin-arginine translocation signal domain-containing protein [Anaerolineales bacterium]|nr:twin-arginine translocation signal domain-containing protein [Anaerolineales bacterium]